MNTNSRLSTVWFGDKEVIKKFITLQRALATSVGGLALPIGCIVGFVMPTFFISEDDSDGKKSLVNYLFVQNGIVTVLCLPVILFS